MKYLYNFYYSTAVKEMAQELGFATLPDIVRDIVVKKLIDVTQCNTNYINISLLLSFSNKSQYGASF